MAPNNEFPKSGPYFAMSRDEVVEAFGSNRSYGLTSDEAQYRLETHGPNQLREDPPPGLWSLVWDQIKEPLVVVLIVAATVSLVVGEWEDSLVILAIVVLNTLLGVTQERRAEQALSALKKLSRPGAKVVRGGHVLSVKSFEVVPGDIILLDAGDFVPADARLLEAVLLRVDESALTGESVPVTKEIEALRADGGDKPALGDQTNMVFMGTVVTAGRGRAVVVATGMDTEIGHIARALGEEPKESTPLQKQLVRLGGSLGIIALFLVAVVFGTGILRGEPVFEMFMAAIGLAVAAVPEGLPAVVTIILAMGVQKMSRERAIVRRLPAVETLGSATLICTDKTGTLTKNEMTVVKIYCNGKILDVDDLVPESGDATVRALLLSGLLANDAHLEEVDGKTRMVGDPTEGALIVVSKKRGLAQDQVTSEHPRQGEIPFDSARKMMTTIHPRSGAYLGVIPGDSPLVAFTKGAPDVLMARCAACLQDGKIVPFSKDLVDRANKVNKSLAQQGLRVLATAFRELSALPDISESYRVERDLTFIGFFAMQDPPRPEVKEAVKESISAGVRPVMITGDHVDTALAIGKELGIWHEGQRYLSGSEVDAMGDDELYGVVEEASIYARVSPEHKLRIVDAYKKHGHIAAMTGDGVNDAPALKKANIGVAMGITGTDVAKEASDIVLADDNFATLVTAIATGRTIFDNIRKVIHYLLSCNAGEIAGIFITIALGLGRPLTAIQILWLNLVTDGLPALALGVDPPEPNTMRRPPRNPREGIIERNLAIEILWQGVLLGLITLGGYYITLRKGVPIEEARTVAFLSLAGAQIVHSFNVRNRRASLFSVGIASNKALLGASATSLLLQAASVLVPFLRPVFGTVLLQPWGWGLVAALSLVPLVVVEVVKMIRISESTYRE